MKSILLTITSLFLMGSHCDGQGETANWYFGAHLGMNFSTDPPILLNNGSMWQLEGSTSISDSTGNLLFYSDGMEVWDRTHKRLPHGWGLFGEESSTQSALILPNPGNSDMYYLFTVDAGPYVDGNLEGLNYAVINLCENDGKGDVLSPGNTLLVKPTAEKVNAVDHANGTDIWVATHGWGNDKFYAYLLTEDGVGHDPVITSTGITYSTNYDGNGLGQLKFSADGKKVAMAKLMEHRVYVFDFDNSTGVVSNPMMLVVSTPYGVEFSDNGTKLYISHLESTRIGQFDLSAGSRDAVQASFTLLPHSHTWVQQLQLANNGKIYLQDCSVINDPNKKGLESDLTSVDIDFVALGAGPQLGLPNFNQSYFDPNPYILYSRNCNETKFNFRIHHADSVQSVQWIFGDPESGDSNTSDKFYPAHQFSEEGTYDVIAEMVLKSGRIITKRKKVIHKDFHFDLGADSVVCDALALALDVTQSEPSCYTWQDGSKAPLYQASVAGWYWVDVRQRGCTKRDSIYLQFETTPDPDMGPDKILCEHETLSLDSKVSNGDVIWSTGETSPEIDIDQPGEYWVEGYNSECKARDTVAIELQVKPVLHMTDTVLCLDQKLHLNLNESNVIYTLNGKTLSQGSVTIDEPGAYKFNASLNGCSLSDTLNVDYIQNPSTRLYDSLVCEDIAVVLSVPYHLPLTNFFWSTGSTDSLLIVPASGVFTVHLTNHCFEETIRFNIDRETCPCDIFVPNIITVNSDEKNELFRPVTNQRITDYDFVILNRWGRKVFETSPVVKSWDGRVEGEEAATGVYFWELRYKCLVGDSETDMRKTGYVHLVR